MENVFAGIPSAICDVCLEKVASLGITYNSRWRAKKNPTLQTPLLIELNVLTHFSLESSPWRELHGSYRRFDLNAEFIVESHYLTQIVCGMNENAESLALPMETAPLDRMSQLPWPRIRRLSLHGRYPLVMRATTLPAVLSRMPTLRSLRIQAAQEHDFSRPRIWDSSMALSSTALSELESLTIAYPDPEDDIFSMKVPRLRHLSLRDEPRYHFQLRNWDFVPISTAAPILTASECLRILRRMETPTLTSLELVYKADASEDTLLRHISSAYPSLARLELHRYRESDDMMVPHVGIPYQFSSIVQVA